MSTHAMASPPVLLARAILLLTAAAAPAAQEVAAPRMVKPTRVDGGLGGHLHLPDGTVQEFHLVVSGVCARLAGSYSPARGEVGLAFGSAEEVRLLGLLQAWAEAAFSAEERKELLALPRLESPRTEAEDLAHARASLLRALHAYRLVTRPHVEKVFAGRGTVTLSMQLRLGDEPPRQILWRRFGDDAFARMHVGTDTEPVTLDSTTEREVLLAMRYWLTGKLGDASLLAEGDPEAASDDVRHVLAAWRGYLTATSPRLRTWGTVMDRARGGSKLFEISDAKDRVITVRFDHAADSPAPGRLLDGGGPEAPPVAPGGARERELLAMLRRAAALRRACRGAAADQDDGLRELERQLADYEQQFGEPK